VNSAMTIAELSDPEMELGLLDVGCVSLFSESQVNDASPKPRTAETSDSSSSIVRTKVCTSFLFFSFLFFVLFFPLVFSQPFRMDSGIVRWVTV